MSLINKEQEYQDHNEWSDKIKKGLEQYRNVRLKTDCYRYSIRGSYQIVFDEEIGWCVDVDGDVIFRDIKLKNIPFPLGNVSGNFDCSFNNLTSLKNCPTRVGGNFDCSFCKSLKTLNHCPKYVKGDFICAGCDVKFFKEKTNCVVGGNFINYMLLK